MTAKPAAIKTPVAALSFEFRAIGLISLQFISTASSIAEFCASFDKTLPIKASNMPHSTGLILKNNPIVIAINAPTQ
jgi:hypothetical protein